MRKIRAAYSTQLNRRSANRSPLALAQLWYTYFLALCLVTLISVAHAEAPAGAVAIAIIDFDYRDTSGEPRDQSAEHQERLSRFMASLRDDLAASGKFRIVAMTCRPDPCSLRSAAATEIFTQARHAGARFLIFGEIHKISTLIQLGNFHVIDVEANTSLIDRILSFRGDSDEAWRRAEAFLSNELERGIRIE